MLETETPTTKHAGSVTQSVEDRLLDAALMHVPFDGWSQATLDAAIMDVGADRAQTVALFPRGGPDLALAYHRSGDRAMLAALARHDLASMRIRERVVLAVRLRLEVCEREAVRRAAALLSLPLYTPLGARALWNTADAIWNALGDTSVDGNWYTKRAILSGVYSATVLYWLGDNSPGNEATWAFLERRIDDVMRFEKAKAEVRKSPVLSKVFALPLAVLDTMRKPGTGDARLPGFWRPPERRN